jgi:hypothetical protein
MQAAMPQDVGDIQKQIDECILANQQMSVKVGLSAD